MRTASGEGQAKYLVAWAGMPGFYAGFRPAISNAT
jgi:hypothetical protein